MAESQAAFRHYVCWRSERVPVVVNLEAERAERSTFLAVHSDRPLRVASAKAGSEDDNRFSQWTSDRFVTHFLKSTETNVGAVIVGKSGTGKSHLIKWLSMRIEETPNRIVLTIPKSGTSLRRIVEMLLDRLPASVSAKHRAALEGQAFESDSPDSRRRSLAAFIALELGKMQPAPGDRKEAWLVPDRLRLLFSDVHLVETKLARDGGLLHKLVDHLGERRGPGASEVPHEFTVSDLPRAGIDIKDAASETQAVLRLLTGDEELEATAVALVNDVLGGAIARALAFPPDRLFEVMLQLRRHLADEGKELVLLIEDLARLQGIDGGLLQALIEDGGKGTDLCILRWCVAITSGPFETRVRETVKTRLTLEVDMTHSAAALASDGAELADFTAKYLNAMRLPEKIVSDWATDVDRMPLANACASCPYVDPCHAAFGAQGGIGLYPFTERALSRMEALVDPAGATSFNPRTFIKGVLKPTFVDHALDWQPPATFPSASFHRDLGGPDGSKITNQRLLSIQEGYPTETARYVALFDLWGDTELSVDPAIAKAFNLTLVGDGPKPPKPTPKPTEVDVEDYGLGESDRRLIAALNVWGSGGSLEDGATNQLRRLVFDAVEAWIDWDQSGITPGFFLRGEGKAYFKQVNISFRRQLLASNPGEVQLMIPARDGVDDFLKASVALQALVVLHGGGRFQRDHGPLEVPQLGAHLEIWAAGVVEQLHSLASRLGPLEDACELLLYRAALAGRAFSIPSAWIDGAFVDPDEIAAPSPAWQNLYADLGEDVTQARRFVRALTSASKGGQARAVIDPRPMLAALDRFLRHG